MVEVRSIMTAQLDTPAALAELDAARPPGATAQFVFAFYGAGHDDVALSAWLTERFPGAAVLGGTSCGGVMSDDGLGSIGLLLIEDPDGSYGSAATALGDDPAAAAEAALGTALERAGCAGELPELIWIYQSPGHEEAVLAGLRRVVGERCPIVGGSSADDDVRGAWRQLGPDGPIVDGLVVGVLFSSGGIGFAFQGGYEPTGASGVVTELGADAAAGPDGRHIVAIDGRRAVEVYDEWNRGVLPAGALDGGSTETGAPGGTTILAETTMRPLAVSAGQIDQVLHFRLIHPEAVSAQGGLTTFATVEVGTRLFAMRGDRERLVQRVGKVAEAAVASLADTELAGALVVYCGGCLLAVGDEAERVAKTATAGLGAPFLGCFTFGEQGMILGRNVHANLMISAVTFGR